MKLATLRDGSRDGVLLVVDRAGERAVKAAGIARTMQEALECWEEVEGPLRGLFEALQSDRVEGAFAIEVDRLHAPLPRAYQWLDGSAFLNHVELVRKARGAEVPASFYEDPLMYQGGSDTFLGPTEDIVHASEEWGIDFEAEVAVVTGDVPYGTKASDALGYIRLLMLANDVSLRNLIPAELAKGFGFVVSKPPTAFSPFAVTPDELGESWQDGRVHLPLEVEYNGAWFGHPNAGPEMQFSFPELIAYVTKTRPLGAGTILGSGTISNKDRSTGSCCLAERRMIEKIEEGESKTPFMRFGDTVRIEMKKGGRSIFGAIAQTVKPWKKES
ncbi:fumarylacetoacetate hydrolase family protein [Myxococcota bacterium]|nr:fumarylacetoacetate hydrolase family protein [Myxococcota bacterium]